MGKHTYYTPRKYWTNRELEFLKSNHGILCTEDIALHLDRSLKAITAKSNILGLTKVQRGKSSRPKHNYDALALNYEGNIK